MTVLGLDLSLTSTGVATFYTDDDSHTVRRIRPKTRGVHRLVDIRDDIINEVTLVPPALALLEGYAYGATNQAAHIGELGGVIRVALEEAHVRWVEIAPASLKKWATGRGNANKELMLSCAIRELGYAGSNNDEADALWIAHLGHMFLYRYDRITAARREVVSKIASLINETIAA